MADAISRTAVLLGAAGAVACVGVVSSLAGPSDHSANAETRTAAAAAVKHASSAGHYAQNARGLTYGVLPNSEATGATDVEDMPDLVGVVAEDGTTGYAYRDELFGSQSAPTSPDEALAGDSENKPHYINVYASDGTTVVGRFLVNRPTKN